MPPQLAGSMSQARTVALFGEGNTGIARSPQPSGDIVRKRAPTCLSPLSATVQSRPPLHAELQSTKAWPGAGVSVSAIVAPSSKAAEQVPGHEMPDGVEVTVPRPSMATLSVCRGGDRLLNPAPTSNGA